MSIEIGESRLWAPKESRNVSYESKMSRVPFLKRIKVHNIKLSQINSLFGGGGGDGGFRFWTDEFFRIRGLLVMNAVEMFKDGFAL